MLRVCANERAPCRSAEAAAHSQHDIVPLRASRSLYAATKQGTLHSTGYSECTYLLLTMWTLARSSGSCRKLHMCCRMPAGSSVADMQLCARFDLVPEAILAPLPACRSLFNTCAPYAAEECESIGRQAVDMRCKALSKGTTQLSMCCPLQGCATNMLIYMVLTILLLKRNTSICVF